MSRDIRVTFFQVKTDKEKRERIVRLAQGYFEKKEPLVIQLPHQRALEYVDLLLWRTPEESFLPHTIKDKPTEDFIALTSPGKNPNNAKSILNLCTQPVDNKEFNFTKIYELEDLGSTHKNHSAQERYKAYKKAGYAIITI